jgi:hypothetical protein
VQQPNEASEKHNNVKCTDRLLQESRVYVNLMEGFALGIEPASSTAEQFGELIAKELREYGKLVKLTGAKVE